MEELEHAQQEEAFFTVESVITPKDYRALYYFNIFHKNKTIKVLSVVIAACMLVVLSSALILDDSKMLTRAITFIVVVFLAEWGVLELGAVSYTHLARSGAKAITPGEKLCRLNMRPCM